MRQQLDSFDEFVQNTMQELVDENSNLVLQHVGGDGDVTVIIINLLYQFFLLMLKFHLYYIRNVILLILDRFTCQNQL